MTKISSVLARAFLGSGQIELPIAGGGTFSVNPGFVMAVQELTPTTTELTVAGHAPVVVELSFAATSSALGG